MQLGQLAELRIGLPTRRWGSSGGREHRMLSAKYINEYGEITGWEPFTALSGIDWDFFSRSGDVIMKLAAPNQALCITREEDCGLLVSSYFAIIRVRQPELCAPEYLAVYLNSAAFAEVAERERVYSTVKSLKLSTLRELEIPLFEPERQRNIVAFSSLVQQERRQFQALLQAKQAYHQQILRRQFGGQHG